MKQNSSIVFHLTTNFLKIRYRVAAFVAFTATAFLVIQSSAVEPSKQVAFDAAKGFIPAQRDLTEIFLQIAGSLEHHGSPVPYLQHMQTEHVRIAALYQRKHGKPLTGYLPQHMTAEYINRLSANWKLLSPDLELDKFAKDAGRQMRDAIQGTRGTGTILIDIFNQHQKRVFDSMTGKSTKVSDFEALKSEVVTRLEVDKKVVDESRYEVAQRDAVSYAIIIHGTTMKLFQRVDRSLKPADAERVKTVLTSIIMDIGKMAQSELEVGIVEWAINGQSTRAK